MKRTIAMGILLLVTSTVTGQSKIEVTREEYARRLEKIKRIAAESQGKIEITVITERIPAKKEGVEIATESESDRRFRKIQRIAAESQGKIEVARITENALADKEKAEIAPESEAARRFRKIQQIAAESQGKIEISIVPVDVSSGQDTVESTEVMASVDQTKRDSQSPREEKTSRNAASGP